MNTYEKGGRGAPPAIQNTQPNKASPLSSVFAATFSAGPADFPRAQPCGFLFAITIEHCLEVREAGSRFQR